MARWTASAKWAAGPALDGRRDLPLALRLSEGLGVARSQLERNVIIEPFRGLGFPVTAQLACACFWVN